MIVKILAEIQIHFYHSTVCSLHQFASCNVNNMDGQSDFDIFQGEMQLYKFDQIINSFHDLCCAEIAKIHGW